MAENFWHPWTVQHGDLTLGDLTQTQARQAVERLLRAGADAGEIHAAFDGRRMVIFTAHIGGKLRACLVGPHHAPVPYPYF